MSYSGPYNNLPKPNNRIGILKTYYYNKKGQLWWWDGKRLRNKAKDKEYRDKPGKKAKKKEYNKEYRENPGKIAKAKEKRDKPVNKARAKEKRDKPKNKAKAKEKRDKPAKKAKAKEYNKEYLERPGKKANMKEYHKEYHHRMKTDLAYKLTKNLRTRHRAGLKSQNLEPTIPVLELMGCPIKSLKIHLESHFEPGMTWDNYGRESGCWNIDHRRCYKSLKLKYIEEQRKCCHWTNLQPMWKPENRAKGSDFDEATFEYKWIDTNLGWIKK